MSDEPRVRVCLLGTFRVLTDGRPVPVRPGGKTELLLAALALDPGFGVERNELLSIVWPLADEALATQSLNTLVYSLHRMFGDALDGRPLIVHDAARYRLNLAAGVAVDVIEFDETASAGERALRAGDIAGAMWWFAQAASRYAGELAVGSNVTHVLERERLRGRYLSISARLAEYAFASGDYDTAMTAALELLRHDSCREDAHRLIMRCSVRQGDRTQALRQYRVCQEALKAEFNAVPEPATDDLYELVRLDPARI